MPQVQKQTEETGRAAIFNFDFAELGKQQFETLTKVQQELFQAFHEINQTWIVRLKSEAELASELITKLTTARSVPDTATAFHECVSRRMELLAEDNRRLIGDGKKLVSLGSRLFGSDAASNK